MSVMTEIVLCSNLLSHNMLTSETIIERFRLLNDPSMYFLGKEIHICILAHDSDVTNRLNFYSENPKCRDMINLKKPINKLSSLIVFVFCGALDVDDQIEYALSFNFPVAVWHCRTEKYKHLNKAVDLKDPLEVKIGLMEVIARHLETRSRD